MKGGAYKRPSGSHGSSTSFDCTYAGAVLTATWDSAGWVPGDCLQVFTYGARGELVLRQTLTDASGEFVVLDFPTPADLFLVIKHRSSVGELQEQAFQVPLLP